MKTINTAWTKAIIISNVISYTGVRIATVEINHNSSPTNLLMLNIL